MILTNRTGFPCMALERDPGLKSQLELASLGNTASVDFFMKWSKKNSVSLSWCDNCVQFSAVLVSMVAAK